VVARSLLARIQREAIWDRNSAICELLSAMLSYPGVPARWREPVSELPQKAVIPIEIRMRDQTLRLFSTITTLGDP